MILLPPNPFLQTFSTRIVWLQSPLLPITVSSKEERSAHGQPRVHTKFVACNKQKQITPTRLHCLQLPSFVTFVEQ